MSYYHKLSTLLKEYDGKWNFAQDLFYTRLDVKSDLQL